MQLRRKEECGDRHLGGGYFIHFGDEIPPRSTPPLPLPKQIRTSSRQTLPQIPNRLPNCHPKHRSLHKNRQSSYSCTRIPRRANRRIVKMKINCIIVNNAVRSGNKKEICGQQNWISCSISKRS